MEIDPHMTQMLKLADKDFLKIFLFLLFKIFLFFKSYWLCYNIASVLCFGFLGPEAYGIFAPWPGIEFVPHALRSGVLNHWAAREVLRQGFVKAVTLTMNEIDIKGAKENMLMKIKK